MSRGGRGGGRGGRGGRGGAQGAGRPNVPWDTGEEPDARPSELFPPYKVPDARPLTAVESSSVKHLLLLRHQLHASSLYTSRRTMTHDPTAPRKMYGQDQTNAQYGVRNRALQDPFTSMPTYAQRFVREERSLPDWTRRPVNRELFPDELLEVIDPEGSRKRRKLELTRVNALPNAEEAFGMANGDYEEEDPFAAEDATGEDGQPQPGSRKSLLDRIDALDGEEGDENTELRDDEEPEEQEPQDEEYDDEDAGDYDAENYFDNGDDIGDDYGDDGEGEGTY